MKECAVESCNRETTHKLCNQHYDAQINLHNNYENWKKAYGSKYTMEKYLTALLSDDIGSGQWVKDIAELEIKKCS